jgi:predicted acetyltransferase
MDIQIVPVELDQKPVLRQLGVGQAVAVQVFDRFPGKWEVLQHGRNRPSYLFWETVIGAYTGGQYTKGSVVTEDWEGQALTFDNSG